MAKQKYTRMQNAVYATATLLFLSGFALIFLMIYKLGCLIIGIQA